MSDIKVTQEDKDRAQEICDNLGLIVGTFEWLSIARSCARHRIEAQRPLLEALIIALDSMESVDGENDCSRGIKSAKAAIKQAKGE